MELVLTACAVGVLVGLVVGALGAGGGILSVPVLTYLLAQEPHAATNGSLVIVAVTALVALPGKARKGQVRWLDGALFGLLSTAGAITGRQINHLLDGQKLFLAFSLLLLAVAGYMFYNASAQRRAENERARNTGSGGDDEARGRSESPGENAPKRKIWLVILAACLTGFLTGLFGVGGGFAVVPVLMAVMKFDMRAAAGTSLLVMIIAAAVSMGTGLVQHHFHVDWPTVLCFTGASALGGLVGGPLSQKARASTLTFIFALLLVAVAAYTLASTLWI